MIFMIEDLRLALCNKQVIYCNTLINQRVMIYLAEKVHTLVFYSMEDQLFPLFG